MQDYFRPGDLSDALAWLDRAGRPCVIAAGCTDLFPATERKTLPGPVLDITGIGALRGVARDGCGWRFGAAATWTEVIAADLPPAFDGLKAAAREVGSVQIQNAGTVAGNLCNASPAADGTPCWLTLEAEVELTAVDGVRRLPVGDFVTGPRRTALRPGELLTAVLVPARAGAGTGAFVKLGARKYLVISIAMVAARLVAEGGRIAEAAVAVGACSAVAVRLGALERALVGQAVGALAFAPELVTRALAPIDDIRADAAYRATGAAELVRRALELAA